MTTVLDSGRALEDESKDQFGLAGIAKRLAPSIVKASKGDGMVIGLEGRWGSGKASCFPGLPYQSYWTPR
ncbi:P-loop NTPase fold protein [Seongchinamella sediminis]|uniref:P-loop NTPase fold protein n=1 Tax=Seongchinamella sediminis TaxID=2283635 RepID=UPI001967DAC2